MTAMTKPATWQLFQCDARKIPLPDGSVRTCVTSPPYWGLRSYLPDVVRINPTIAIEKQAEIVAELQALGVFPVDHTGE